MCPKNDSICKPRPDWLMQVRKFKICPPFTEASDPSQRTQFISATESITSFKVYGALTHMLHTTRMCECSVRVHISTPSQPAQELQTLRCVTFSSIQLYGRYVVMVKVLLWIQAFSWQQHTTHFTFQHVIKDLSCKDLENCVTCEKECDIFVVLENGSNFHMFAFYLQPHLNKGFFLNNNTKIHSSVRKLMLLVCNVEENGSWRKAVGAHDGKRRSVKSNLCQNLLSCNTWVSSKYQLSCAVV